MRAGRADKPELTIPSWAWLVVAAALTGAGAGGLGAAFRRVLELADDARNALIDWAETLGAGGWVFPTAACAVGAGLAVWLVQRFAPSDAGSGIPLVERVVEGKVDPPSIRLPLAVKFTSGALGIGSGLALGREGPTIQMGAAVGQMVGRMSRRLPDVRTLMAAGAGAGLGAAFNAPLAGALFTLEELLHRFTVRLVAATLVACVAAIVVLRAWLGSAPDFDVPDYSFQSAGALVAFAVVGVLAALAGVLFDRSLLATLRLADRARGWPRGTKGALVGAAIGLTAWFFPDVVGGGDNLSQDALTGAATLTGLAALFAARFVMVLGSYGTGAAGGLFAPLLVLGSELGRFVGEAGAAIAPGSAPDPGALALAGMAGLVVATVRAPLTGVALVLEMTGAFALILPLLMTAAVAYVIPWALRDTPVYDALRERDEALAEGEAQAPSAGGEAAARPHRGAVRGSRTAP